jgi:hypothetical protein
LKKYAGSSIFIRMEIPDTSTRSDKHFLVLLYTALVAATGLCGFNSAANAQANNTTNTPPAAQTASTNAADLEMLLKKAAAQPPAPFEGAGWKSLFDGHSLAGWAVTDFAGHGSVECEDGLVVIDMGDSLSGVNYTNGGVPTMNYEVALDAMKLTGSDFFCGLTFPIGNTNCSLILGGWGGGTVGISSIDGEDASENETAQVMKFDKNRWYRVRVRVTDGRIQSWIDDKKIVDVKIEGRRIGLRFGEIELSRPLGIATYQTTAAVREIKIRRLEKGK